MGPFIVVLVTLTLAGALIVLLVLRGMKFPMAAPRQLDGQQEPESPEVVADVVSQPSPRTIDAVRQNSVPPAASEHFEPDTQVQQMAEAYALDAVDYARDGFRTRLDWSDDSIRQVEAVLTRLHNDMPAAKPSEEQIMGMAKMFGSYIGEVFRKNHGATWGWVSLQSERFPGLRVATRDVLFWPWGRVYKRIMNGPEDNVWHYYVMHVKETSPHGQLINPDGTPYVAAPWK